MKMMSNPTNKIINPIKVVTMHVPVYFKPKRRIKIPIMRIIIPFNPLLIFHNQAKNKTAINILNLMVLETSITISIKKVNKYVQYKLYLKGRTT
jgi:hypothetical protein